MVYGSQPSSFSFFLFSFAPFHGLLLFSVQSTLAGSWIVREGGKGGLGFVLFLFLELGRSLRSGRRGKRRRSRRLRSKGRGVVERGEAEVERRGFLRRESP